MFKEVLKLLKCFPRSFMNQHGEVIVHKRANEYFNISNCDNVFEIKCKVLEWLSRGACKTEPYKQNKKNEEFNKFMLDGINEYLETNFTIDEMEKIYTYLGNCCNRKRTVKFINSNYDFEMLKWKEGNQ